MSDVNRHPLLLQGIITNDPHLLQNGSKEVMYTAFLNAQGRFLHDAFLYATGKAACVVYAFASAVLLKNNKGNKKKGLFVQGSPSVYSQMSTGPTSQPSNGCSECGSRPLCSFTMQIALIGLNGALIDRAEQRLGPVTPGTSSEPRWR